MNDRSKHRLSKYVPSWLVRVLVGLDLLVFVAFTLVGRFDSRICDNDGLNCVTQTQTWSQALELGWKWALLCGFALAIAGFLSQLPAIKRSEWRVTIVGSVMSMIMVGTIAMLLSLTAFSHVPPF